MLKSHTWLVAAVGWMVPIKNISSIITESSASLFCSRTMPCGAQ